MFALFRIFRVLCRVSLLRFLQLDILATFAVVVLSDSVKLEEITNNVQLPNIRETKTEQD